MKKHLLLLISILLFNSENIYSGFSARMVNQDYYWWLTEIHKLESNIQVYGLFYETTIDLSLKLGKDVTWNWQNGQYICADPNPGDYEFMWSFQFPKDAFIKDLQVWDKNKNTFVSAAMIDLTTAELEYEYNKSHNLNALLRQYMRRDYNGNYNQEYDLRLSPIKSDEIIELKISIISPCKMQFFKRIISDFSNQFYTPAYTYGNVNCNINSQARILVTDLNNPSIAPKNFNGINTAWTKSENGWLATIADNYYSQFQLEMAPESVNGEFLSTYNDGTNKFFQLATQPHISDELRSPRNIVLAFDMVDMNINQFKRNDFLDMIKSPLNISTTNKDSIVVITSDFNVNWLDQSFVPRTEYLIENKIDQVKQIVPKLNTLPYMLKEIVRFLNTQNKDAEVWIISNDYLTTQRPETAMDLLQQSYFQANKKIVFRILDASANYYSFYYQNKYYNGNGYLYENLSRISGGSYEVLRGVYMWSNIDKILDCFAPTVSTVEIDPVPQGGVTYSSVNLNDDRNNFDITDRYFQFGMFEGETPFEVNYYGYLNNNDYFTSFNLTDDETAIPEEISKNTSLYWYGDYIMNDLFLQPQSYSTIKYIEQLSTDNRIITPYSGFIIPGPGGYRGFKRIYVGSDSTESTDSLQTEDPLVPQEISLTAYPNPFNPSTTININLNAEALKGERKLEIFNILGQKVRSFDLVKFENSGSVSLVWNGLNENGISVSSGTYIAVLKTMNISKTFKLLLVR